VIRIRISPDAKTAIGKQFELLELSEPGIYLLRKPPAADVSRSASGEVVWKVERPQLCHLHFGELPLPASDKKRVQIIEGIRIWALRFGDDEDIEIEITTDNRDLFVDVLPCSGLRQSSTSGERTTPRPDLRSDLRLGLIPEREIVSAEGQNRLSLFYIAEGFGQDFHSLQWDCRATDAWREKLSLTRKQFQGLHPYRRWVTKLHSFAPATGIAIVQVAEGDRPIDPPASCSFLYSWRAWDLLKNIEVKKLKDCKDPFDPLE
jgi:hypothetical protein